MEPRFFNTMSNTTYSTLWNKYRPVIIRLMIAAEDSPQEYRFFDHEFKTANSKEKKYSFELNAHKGRALNNIKASSVAQELLAALRMSRKGSELLDEFRFEFSMDKQFVFHVARKQNI
jgi:hypothetical protein